MKGVIPSCLAELVQEKYGKDKWGDIMEDVGMKRSMFFMPSANIDDATVLKVVESTCSVLKITPTQAANAFGDYWMNIYAPKIYSMYYRRIDNARDFLLNMDKVHKTVTERIPDAQPPRFEYEWVNDKTLVMKYKSHRGLLHLLIGLVRGVGIHFNENLRVTKIGSDKIQVIFQ